MTDQGCMLCGYGRAVVDAVNRCSEANTFVPALGYTFAGNPTEVTVQHAARAAGTSTYSLYRLLRLNFDLMTGFSLVPLQIFTMAGLVIALLSLLFVAYLAVRRLVVGPEAEGVFTLFGILFFLIGVLLLGLGIVGEYVGRIYQQVRHRPRYVIAAIVAQPQKPAAPALTHLDAARRQSE
jgi:undecaprenyl-phosphate 4-deoxy-4-formamido-L-arabinose transferase